MDNITLQPKNQNKDKSLRSSYCCLMRALHSYRKNCGSLTKNPSTMKIYMQKIKAQKKIFLDVFFFFRKWFELVEAEICQFLTLKLIWNTL